MSGKKASEVSALLARGTEAMEVGKVNFYNIITKSENSIRSCEKDYNLIINSISSQKCNLSKEAYKELQTESEQVEKQFTSLKNSLKSKSYNLAEINNEVKRLDRKLSELDCETAKLHQIIRRSPHYCDNEYIKADEIVKEYKEIATMRNKIAERAKSLSSGANMDLHNAQNRLKQMENLLESINKLNKKAKEIVLLRNEASKAKDFVDHEIKSIDETIAKKFLEKEYREIQGLYQAIMNMNDQEVVNQFKQIEEKISFFKNILQQKHAIFEAEREEATVYIKEIESLMEKDQFYHPMDYAKKKENAEGITLETFLNDYAKGEYIAEIKIGITKAQKELVAEDFQGAKAQADVLRTTIEKAISYANLKQESILKNIFMALDIRNVMRNLNYQADASIIDNDITKGFRIKCKIGDEIIDFEKVLVDESGEVTIDIDHTESVSGTCGVKWTNLQQEFVEHGILLRDVTKNGNSVIRREFEKVNEGKTHKQLM